MCSAEKLFQRLIKDLRPALSAHDFVRRSQNFICESSECWGIINFQKSRYSLPDEKLFTVNLAIAAKGILAYEGKPSDTAPPSYTCPWVIRIGELMPDRQDKWWTLADEASYGSMKNEVESALTALAVPIIKTHLTQQGLLELMASKTPGYFEYPRLKYKSILLAQDKKFDALPEIFQRIREICRGSSAERGAEEHIAQLKKHFSLP
jgi:hypothetical protein